MRPSREVERGGRRLPAELRLELVHVAAPLAELPLRPADAVLVEGQVGLALALPAALAGEVGLGDRRARRQLAAAWAEGGDEVGRHRVVAGTDRAGIGDGLAVQDQAG